MTQDQGVPSSARGYLVQANQAQAIIVTPPDPAPLVGYAATELQHHLELLTGASFRLVKASSAPPGVPWLVVDTLHHPVPAELQVPGPVPAPPLREDGYLIYTQIRNSQPSCVLRGANQRGTLYAVYEFLQQMGIVFTTTGTVIPDRKDSLPWPELNLRHEPELPFRGHHMRHFVMPWMGCDDLRTYLDNLARLKCNYLEFFWYEGAPWVKYQHRGDVRLIGDLYTPESGYTSWRTETYRFQPSDMVVGRDLYPDNWAFAPEFADCTSSIPAEVAAHKYLTQALNHARERGISMWLGAGDCPYVPPGLARQSPGIPSRLFGKLVPPGDPTGVEIWTEIVCSMIETYPQAAGYWLWLAESYITDLTDNDKAALENVAHLKPFLPDKTAIAAMGYDQYVQDKSEEALQHDALVQLYYAAAVIKGVRQRHPGARLGVSLLGRSYLFAALNQLLPPEIALQSMEASICWNRGSRVPLENFREAAGRDLFLVPRLDDDANELAAQFNVKLYAHDRVTQAPQFGITGVAPQVGKTRGLEHNASFIAAGAWNTSLQPSEFYAAYCERLYGSTAAMAEVYLELEAADMFLGLEVPVEDAGTAFCGLDNFLNYGDAPAITWLSSVRHYPLVGPENLDAPAAEQQRRRLQWRVQRLEQGISRYQSARSRLRQVLPAVAAGARNQAEYLDHKITSFIFHLQTVSAIWRGRLEYESAFLAKAAGEQDEALGHFYECYAQFSQAEELARATAEALVPAVDNPTERHILFRHNVRFLLPLREFRTFIGNLYHYHCGVPYWDEVNWKLIAPDWPPA